MKNTVNSFRIAGYVVLYVVTIFATAFLGFLHPICWAGLPVVAALLAAFSYYGLAQYWRFFGAGTLLSLALSLFLCATGELEVRESVIMVAFGFLSDIVRQYVGISSLKGLLVAYPILSLGDISWVYKLWTNTDWYYDGAVEEMGLEYAEGLMAFAHWWVFALVVILTLVMSYLGVLVSSRLVIFK